MAELVTVLSSIMADMLEMNATIAKAVVPSSTHLDANEKHNLMIYLESVPTVARQLKGVCDQIKVQLKDNGDADSTEQKATETSEDALSGADYEELKTKAETGDPEAQFHFGELFDHEGKDAEAAAWYLKAAEQGFAPAQCNIGTFYNNGSGVPEDEERACYWFRKALEQGFANARFELGRLLERRNIKEAIEFYRELAEQGDSHSQARLANLFGDGIDVPKDDAEAFRWFLQTAQSAKTREDYFFHFIEVGRRYLFGEGTKKNIKEAIK
ncbi:MAG TPA: tetratricopeptide repeat protein, partial [Candidatus Paceibacterota bacterium]|nr:tetratricopeptide repeat protein [Candidatus Paceibacterota bacterium]